MNIQKSAIYYKSPSNLSYIKPNVSCYSLTGTSFSAPIITGLVACILEKFPDISNDSLLKSIHNGSHLKEAPNYYVGYGVPQSNLIFDYINGIKPESNFKIINTNSKKIEINLLQNSFVVFNQLDDNQVIDQQVVLKYKSDQYIVKKIKHSKTTIIDFGIKGTVKINWL